MVQRVLGADAGGQGRAEIARHGADQGIQRADLGHVQATAALFQLLAQIAVNQCVQNDARRGFYFLQHPLHLL